jgi:hypothetical protein
MLDVHKSSLVHMSLIYQVQVAVHDGDENFVMFLSSPVLLLMKDYGSAVAVVVQNLTMLTKLLMMVVLVTLSRTRRIGSSVMKRIVMNFSILTSPAVGETGISPNGLWQ